MCVPVVTFFPPPVTLPSVLSAVCIAQNSYLAEIVYLSVLGPILFLIYVNDIPEMVNCSIKMFADDTKLFRTVKSIDDCNI